MMLEIDIRYMAQNMSMLFLGLAIFMWTIIQADHWEDERRERKKTLQNSKKLL